MDVITFFEQQDNERVKEIKALTKVRNQEFKKMFYDVLGTILQIPTIESFYVRQGTPSFNDGDACYFSVYNAHFVPVDVDEDEKYDDSFELKEHIEDEALRKMAVRFEHLVYNHDECMEALFGNGVKLIFTMSNKGKITYTEEYCYFD